MNDVGSADDLVHDINVGARELGSNAKSIDLFNHERDRPRAGEICRAVAEAF